MTKTLGEVNEDAFEDAYREHMDKAPMGYGSSWVGAAERLAWQAAAEAVLHHFVEQKATTFDERLTKERAVIEAACHSRFDLQSYVERHEQLFGTQFEHSFSKLLGAVEALEEVER